MNGRLSRLLVATGIAVAASATLGGQTPRTSGQSPAESSWSARTPWGDPDYQGEWTSEGEYGVPFERPAQYGTRAFLTDAEYAKRLDDVRVRDERDLARVDVNAGKVDAPNAPIPHWREYNTNSRRTSLIVDPPDGRLPKRTSQSARPLGPQRCGTLQGGEPCDSYVDYGLGVRCIVHGGGFPDAMFPAVYNANFRFVQSPGFVAITYELIHDTRVIPLDGTRHPNMNIRQWNGDSVGHWEGNTLVVDTANFNNKGWIATNVASGRIKGIPQSEALHVIERFTRVAPDTIQYEITIEDPNVYTRPWKVAFPLGKDPAAALFEYACHEGNYAMSNILRGARAEELAAEEAAKKQK